MKASQLLCAMLLCVTCVFGGACAGPVTPAATSIPGAVVIEKTAVIEKATAVEPAATQAPALALITPTADIVKNVLAGIDNTKDMPADHVRPPQGLLSDLAKTYAILSEKQELFNPCQGACDFFNPDRATTYSLPMAGAYQTGALYQLVSLRDPVDGALVESKAWEKRGLVIGGLLIYQDNAVLPAADAPPPPGAYLVVLRRYQNDLQAELWDVGAEKYFKTGPWLLRQRQGLTQIAKEPFSYVTPDELCFSQLEFQACLLAKTPTVGSNQNAEAIQNAVKNLQAGGLLPPDARVNISGAMPGAQGQSSIAQCSDLIQKDPKGCPPDVVAAGMDALIEQTDLNSDAVSELVAGIGVLEVLAPMPDEVFNPDGKLATLEPGSYRLDLLHTREGSWLAQFVHADGKQIFYLYAVEVAARGIPIDPETLKAFDGPNGSSQVFLDRYFWTFCQSSRVTPNSCTGGAKWLRDWCVTNWRAGWCDTIGYGG